MLNLDMLNLFTMQNQLEILTAKAAFNEINAQRTAAGLPALTWSDDLYNSTTLLHAKNISHRYNSDGIVYRRESDASVVFVTFS